MKPCSEFVPWLSSLVDNELTVAERAELDRHLEGCAECRVRLDDVRRLRTQLRGKRASPAAPPSLRQRVTAAVEGRHRRPSLLRRLWTGRLWWASAAAVVLTVALVSALRDAGRRVSVERVFLDDHIEYVGRADPFEVVGPNPADIERWFRERPVDFPVNPPRIDGTKLLGGRLCYLLDRPTGLLFYEMNGVRLSLFVRPTGDLEPSRSRSVQREGKQFEVYCDKGYCLLIRRSGGLAYVLVGALPEDELIGLAERSL